jgi:hypothetical protein
LKCEAFNKIQYNLKNKIDREIVDDNNLDVINKQMEEYIQIPYSKWILKRKPKYDSISQKISKEHGIKLTKLLVFL